jgi:hypothetical protein
MLHKSCTTNLKNALVWFRWLQGNATGSGRREQRYLLSPRGNSLSDGHVTVEPRASPHRNLDHTRRWDLKRLCVPSSVPIGAALRFTGAWKDI